MVNSAEKSLTVEVNDLISLENAAIRIMDFADDYRIWTLNGEMGSGKTTFVKAVGKAVGILDTVNSPTFSIVNEYKDRADQTYYHFDFYRIKDEEEAQDIGVDEYFYSGNYCFIEWPSLIPSLLPDEYLSVNIEIIDRDKRLINCIKNG